MRILIILIGLLWFSTAFAQQRFCSISREPRYASSILENDLNRLDFKNHGGLFNGGTCWWHSRFTRNAIYLAKFEPAAPIPNIQTIKKIIKNIRKGKEIVHIPGYANLQEFSHENEDLIQRELNAWQRFDGFIRQQWVIGLWGWRRLPANKLKARMEYLYDYVKRDGKIAYMTLQLKGISAHSWLVTDMKKLSDGYELTIIDSNYYEPISYTYHYGDRSFQTENYGRLVPYLGKSKEVERLNRIRKTYCQVK